jgi:hypothetical protein
MMNVKSALCYALLLLALLVGGVQAIGVTLETRQPTYRPGETILVLATVTNPYPSGIDATLVCQVSGPTAASEILVPLPLHLGPGETISSVIQQVPVTVESPPGTYVVSADLQVNDIPMGQGSISYTVEGTLRDFSVLVLVCRDPLCSGESQVFLPDEMVHLVSVASVEGVRADGTIRGPDGAVQQVILPAEVPAGKPGSYTVEIVASKDGYRRKELRTEFAVIEQEPHIVAGAPRVTAPYTPVPTPTQASGFGAIWVSISLILLAASRETAHRRR